VEVCTAFGLRSITPIGRSLGAARPRLSLRVIGRVAFAIHTLD
jgi:hypothetical protein